MATETGELAAIESAVNDSAGQVRALWIAFITFATYLVIAVGSVTHRMLFLETPIKLPVLDVDLPLVGFFVIAPFVFLIFYFYTLLQLHALSRKLTLYNETLTQAFPDAADRRTRRHRLDPFAFVQLRAGTREDRPGLTSVLSRIVTDITMIGAPIFLLLEMQVVFLPYHMQRVTWLQRIEIVAALVLLWCFWPAIRYGRDVVENPPLRRHKIFFACSILVFFFSVFIATFPGEALRGILARVAPPIVLASDFLFHGAVNEVTGAPRSWFSNVLVLMDQSFIDSDKLDRLDKLDRTVSLRGRDLRGAVLARADLRKADFTGANLNGARLDEAKLNSAQFGCAKTGKSKSVPGYRETETFEMPVFGCTWIQNASLTSARLQGASFEGAQLQGTKLNGAQLQGASLEKAQLQGASLEFAQLQGASLNEAQLQRASLVAVQFQGASLIEAQLQRADFDGGGPLFPAAFQGASLNDAQLQGAKLRYAQLQGATLRFAQLQGAVLDETSLQGAELDYATLSGASLNEAQLQGASLIGAQLQGASLRGAKLQGALLKDTYLQGASLAQASLWRTRGHPKLLDFTTLNDPINQTPLFEPLESNKFEAWRDRILAKLPDDESRATVNERISVLDPDKSDPSDIVSETDWAEARKKSPTGVAYEQQMTAFLIELACSSEDAPFSEHAPFVAHGLIYNRRIIEAGSHLPEVAEKLKDPKGCPGAVGLSADDLADLDSLVDEQKKKTTP